MKWFNNRRNVLVWVVFALAWLPAEQGQAQKIVSWNLEWFPGRQAENPDPAEAARQMEEAKAVLGRLQPDVFVGIEMRNREVFGELVSVVTGMQVAVVSAFRDDDGRIDRQQIGIASRYPIHAAWAETWIPTMDRLPRGFAIAALREPSSGKMLVVYGVHLKSNRSSNEREAALNLKLRNESAFQLAADVAELKRLAFAEDEVLGWVIAGDFNTNHDGKFGDNAINILTGAGFHNTWVEVAAQDRLTWIAATNSLYPSTTLDYIMTRGLGKKKAAVAISPESASDHVPVVLDLSPSGAE